MAVSAARSKIFPRPSDVARCDAVLKTFSNTRGTASRNVGWKTARSGTRFLMSALCQSHPGLDRPDLDDPREDVGERQEEQRRRVVGLEQLVQLGYGDPELEHEVAVGQLAAL